MRPLAAVVVVALAVVVSWPRPAQALRVAPRPAAADFGAQAKILFRAVACGGSDAVASHLPGKTIDRHCELLRKQYTRFEERFAAQARPFLAALRPAGAPRTVVYPFGGGDLLFALLAFPDASEITSVSLERAGNAATIDKISATDFRAGLADASLMIRRLLSTDYSFTEHMEAMQASKLPVQLCMVLAGLAALGYEPVHLRYFQLGALGEVVYLQPDTSRKARPERSATTYASRRGVFAGIPAEYANIELGFRKVGEAEVRVYRSIAGNLHDGQLTAGSPLLRHLEQKGQIVALVKAASYLLWRDDFSQIRNYLLAQATWMVSDSTGILPMHAAPAGFVQETYGRFKGSLLRTGQARNKDMIALWKAQPYRAVPFGFGYPDWEKKGGHLLVTRK